MYQTYAGGGHLRVIFRNFIRIVSRVLDKWQDHWVGTSSAYNLLGSIE
jgi:hypothetical protein